MSYEERDMTAYYQARADEQIWQKAKEHGVSRRRFLELAGLVGGSALLGAACTDDKRRMRPRRRPVPRPRSSRTS